ncbi:hypothetical protein VTH8203_01636 [Vibrio thalassae]|uniref:Uncharacterized protein n=1 Tax=Vibrio thalassae TaxID=1243014 RepID=A0A240EJ98_9VIBR|nr:hypothetical protein [Vibrio thalassae]SNX48020.1 hypothetical protein VTH8203_01636 [Vibrio thalassae]
MYFYEIERVSENGFKKEIHGPFLVNARKLLELHESIGGKASLTVEDIDILQSAKKQYTLYENTPLPLDTDFIIRNRATMHEYKAVFTLNKPLYKLTDWLDYVGINESQHRNINSGRTTVGCGVLKKLHDILISHSFVLESTAFALSSLEIDGESVQGFDRNQFGDHAPTLLGALKSSRNIMLTYYWSSRSHIDLMQAYIYLSTFDMRRKSHYVNSWYMSPEYYAFISRRAIKSSKKLNKKMAIRLLELLKKHKDSDSTPEQKQALDDLIGDALSTLAFCGTTVSAEKKIETLEKLITGGQGGKRDLDFTYSASGLHVPENDDDDSIN